MCVRLWWTALNGVHSVQHVSGPPRYIEYHHVAGINITFRLEQVLQFRSQSGATVDRPPQTRATLGFLKLLKEEPSAFEELYVASFQVLDREWLATKASRMQFACVLDNTIDEVQTVLLLHPGSIAVLREHLGLGPPAVGRG
jgi:hypothetical protein